MKLAVIDASYAGAWLIPDETSDDADQLLGNILGGSMEMAVPALWSYEICNLIRSAWRRERVSEADATTAMNLMIRVPRQTYDHHEVLFQRRLMTLAIRFDLSAYDAAYLELADRLQCPLYTNDHRLRDAAKILGLVD